MALRVVISAFAGGQPAQAQIPGLHVIDWPGEGSGHPTWGGPAQRLRDPAGPLIPNLLRHYGVKLSDVDRIGVLGFSAGFGGARALLADSSDRARVDFACVLDSLHFPVVGGTWKNFRPDEPATIIDFEHTVGPFLKFAALAAQGQKLWISTWGDIPRPADSVTNAREGNLLLYYALQSSAPVSPIAIPDGFPLDRTNPKLWPNEPYPVPQGIYGSANALGLYYPLAADHSLAALKHSHIVQAQVIRLDLWRDFIVPRWGGAWHEPPQAAASGPGGGVIPASYTPPSGAAKTAAQWWPVLPLWTLGALASGLATEIGARLLA